MEIVFVHQFIHENAPADEKDVLEQRDELAEIFINMGYAISSRSIQSQLDLILLQELANKDCIVFNLCESLFGRDDLLFLVPFMLEHYNIPFTGSGSMALALSCHKLESKSLMINNFIPTPRHITSSTQYNNNLNGTYIIKPYNTHASIHITQDSVIRVHSKHDFDLLLDRLKTSHALFAEEYIDGREFNISLMQTDEGVLILPHAEIIFENYPPNMYKIVDYDAKWAHDSFAYEHTIRNFYFPEDDSPLLNEIDRLSLKVWELFSLNGYARIDYRIRGNEIFILEVNANPCISIYSGFMAAVKQYGLSFQDALDIILKHPIKTNKINI
ncbi:MAG TPA: ATP-grasp domain-containing protein [Spirochaetota bacterium]|nr:ATP-grasp domain-containing protein [Spirochaetota bacterium]